MSSELIKDPTPKTHPTILTECQPSFIMGQLFEADSDPTASTEKHHSTAPRDFATLMKLKEYHDQFHNPVNRDELEGENKLLNKLKEWWEEISDVAIFFFIVSLALFVPFGILWGSIEIAVKCDSPALFLIAPILLAGYFYGLYKFTSSDSEHKHPLARYTLIHVEKPLLSTLFLDSKRHKFCAPEPVNMYQIHYKLLTKLGELFSTDSSILQSIDFYEFSVLYDSYMDMLVFLLTNKHALSSELRDEYIENLYKKSIALEHEADAILEVIGTQKEFKLKAAYDSEQLRQEMLDSEARSIMPLDD